MIENLKEFLGAALPIAVDGAVLLLILAVALIHAKKGLYNSFMPLVVLILSVVIGFSAANMLTPTVEPYVWPHVEKYIAEHTDRFADMDSINSEFVDGDVDYLEGGDEQFAKEIKEKLAEVAMLRAKLICKKAVHVALLIVCTLLAWLILTILKKIFAGLADWSVIGWANKLGGFIVGTCEALLILIILSRVFDIAGIGLLNDLSDGTYVLNWITNGDINAALHELKTLDIQGLRQIELKELKNIDYSNIASQVRRLFSVQK